MWLGSIQRLWGPPISEESTTSSAVPVNQSMEFECSPPVSYQACPLTVSTTTVNAFSVSTVPLTSSAALVSTASMSTTSATTVIVSSVPLTTVSTATMSTASTVSVSASKSTSPVASSLFCDTIYLELPGRVCSWNNKDYVV